MSMWCLKDMEFGYLKPQLKTNKSNINSICQYSTLALDIVLTQWLFTFKSTQKVSNVRQMLIWLEMKIELTLSSNLSLLSTSNIG